jgi:hypothetical protein
MDIFYHFIDFMTYEMLWRTPPLSVTTEFILHTLKLVFHWNVTSMSHVHCFCDSLKYCESVSLKQCGHSQPTFLLYPNKLCATGESLTVTNKLALRPKYSRFYSSQTCTLSLYHNSFISSTKGLK